LSESLSVAERGVAGPIVGGPARDAAAPGRSGPVAWRFFISWALGWALVGFAVAAGITFSRGSSDFGPLLSSSILFAEVVGFTSLVSARLIFPLYAKLPFALRVALQVATLVVGTVAGSAAILATQPLYLLANIRLLAVIMLINAVLAVFVGIAVHTYDAMRRELEANFRALRAKEALEREVAIAREVQRELLPRSVPSVRGLELAVGVGGDYYDFLPLPDDRIGIVIADVSGKGIPAALLMAGLQASVRSLALPGISPCEINRRLNEMLHQSTSASRYATLFFALYDPQDRSLQYSNAGHCRPIHVGPPDVARLSQGGLPIGLMPGSLYGEGRRELGVGDLVAFFTDGVVETPNAQGEEFGDARLIEVLSHHRDSPLDDVLTSVVDAVARWSDGGTPHDDLTLVLARTR
jgi:serine phosphatase RsbU (regulator of sigma subunit)